MINNIAESGKLTWFLGIAVQYEPRHLVDIVSGLAESCRASHPDILRALHDNDPDTARNATHAHVTRAGRLLVRHLDLQGFWEDGD